MPQSIVQTAFRLLSALVLVLALAFASAAFADEPKPLNLEATSNAVGAIENTLKQTSLADADLQRLRTDNDQLGVALLAAITDMAPRLDASAKRVAELTPKKDKDKDKDAAPTTDAATAELDVEQKKHDALDANLRAARALLFRVDDNATRIGARRRDLFARETFAQSFSLFSPQLWGAVWREIPYDVREIASIASESAESLAGRLTKARAFGLAGVLALIALVAFPVHWIARRVIYRDPAAGSPSRLRRALAAGWTLLVLAALPLLGLWALRLALDQFGVTEERGRGFIDAVTDAAGLLVLVNAVGRAMLAPRAAAWRMIPISDRAARRVLRAALLIAAVWAAERLIEPAADAVASFNSADAGRPQAAALVAREIVHAQRRRAPRRGG